MTGRVRYMRLIVFFDLPMETAYQRREYARFRKFLMKSGFLMLQKSVYVKLAIDGRAVGSYVASLMQNVPADGLVQALQVTEKQYAGMYQIAGEHKSGGEIESTDSLVVI